MKQIADKSFFDSNIIVYCYTNTEIQKQAKAFDIIDNCQEPYISTQVLQEFCNVVHKKFTTANLDIEQALSEIGTLLLIHTNTIETIRTANFIKSKYNLSFYDSLIIAAALACNCTILYSENMHHGQVIENKLTIVNPFI